MPPKNLTETEYGLSGYDALSPARGQVKIIAIKALQLKERGTLIKVETDAGISGYGECHGSGQFARPAIAALEGPRLPHLGLIGKDPLAIQLHFHNMFYAYPQRGRIVRVLSGIDIALWDLAGRKYGLSVSKMLGGFRTKLPTYASTYHGQDVPGGLDSPEAFADYALACKEKGFAGFKIHGWHDGDARKEARNVLLVRECVGNDFALMLDPACQLRTYLDALFVGRACDEANYFWYEDPYRDTGVAATGHQRLRAQLRTPLLVSEHVRGVEQKAAFLLAGGCDLIHADPEYDLGITGAMKIAHFCEALGLDVQLHACGPAHRAVMSALRNTHFYEMALIGPGMPNAIPPVYTSDYSDQPEDLASDGTVPVPRGPGLGVEYDWRYIEQNRTALFVFGAK